MQKWTTFFFFYRRTKEKLASRRRNQGNIPHEIFATHCYPHCVVLNILSFRDTGTFARIAVAREWAPRGGTMDTRHFSIQRCMLLDFSTRSLRYLHKSWCNCRERWLAGITEIRNDEAREVECRRETGWCWVAGHYLSPLFYVYSWGWQEQLFWRWDTDCRVSLK